jgi:predicted ArsR family transcriptional regulator
MPARLTDAKRRVVDRLKHVESPATVSELAASLDLTAAAVRQHLDGLERFGLVERRDRPVGGRGRPPTAWSLTPLAADLYPDRHADLTADLIDALRTTLGDDVLDRVVQARAGTQLLAYREDVPRPGEGSVRQRVGALARRRSAEGYMAEVRRDGDAWLLVEHHCPIGVAARVCAGLCRTELELFRATLGPDVEVERTQHVIAGDARCAYRIRERD